MVIINLYLNQLCSWTIISAYNTDSMKTLGMKELYNNEQVKMKIWPLYQKWQSLIEFHVDTEKWRAMFF